MVCKRIIACKNSDNTVFDRFVDVNKTIDMPKGAKKKIDDLMLSRYACYLIVQNSDPRKEVIALGQTYFAVKTRQQEIIENYDELSEEQKRVAIGKNVIGTVDVIISKIDEDIKLKIKLRK